MVLLDQNLYGMTKGPGLFQQDWSKFYISEFIFKPNKKQFSKASLKIKILKTFYNFPNLFFEAPYKAVKSWLQKRFTSQYHQSRFFEKTNLVTTCLEANKQTLIKRKKLVW